MMMARYMKLEVSWATPNRYRYSDFVEGARFIRGRLTDGIFGQIFVLLTSRHFIHIKQAYIF